MSRRELAIGYYNLIGDDRVGGLGLWSDGDLRPQVVFQKVPPPGRANLSPAEGMQFFGEIVASAEDESLTVHLRDLRGKALHTQRLGSL